MKLKYHRTLTDLIFTPHICKSLRKIMKLKITMLAITAHFSIIVRAVQGMKHFLPAPMLVQWDLFTEMN